MKNRLPLFFAISIILSACNSSKTPTIFTDLNKTEQETLVTDMAILDKPYVTTLFYSNMKASPSLFNDAKATINSLDKQWKDFKTINETRFDAIEWKNGFITVDDNLATANSHYETINTFPANLTTAHLAMEGVREVMKKMRAEIDLTTYLMDSVTDTHHKMEPISSGYTTYSASTDSTAIDALKTTLHASLPAFAEALQKLNEQYGDGVKTKVLYDLSDQKSARLSRNISNTDPEKLGLIQIVDALKKELAKDNNPKIVQLASKIKGKFVAIFLGFGDFVTPFEKDFVAVQKAIIPMFYCTDNPSDADSACLNNKATSKEGVIGYVNASVMALTKLKTHFPSNENIKLPQLLGWEKTFSKLDTSLEKVTTTLSNASDLAMAKNNGAHLEAEIIREAFYSLLATYEGKVSMLTQMDEYRAVFEKILLLVMDGNVSNADIDAIKLKMPALKTSFDTLSKKVQATDKVQWGIKNVDIEALLLAQQNNIKELSNELTAFDGVTNDNGSLIGQKVKALEGLYIPLFKAFGAF